MKLMNINKTALFTLLLTLVFVSSVCAWGREGKYRCNRDTGDRTERLAELNSEQKDQLAALRQQFVDDTAETRIALNTARANLEIIMNTSKPDEKAIKKLIQEITNLEAVLLEKKVNHQIEIRKVAPELAPEKMAPCCRQKGGRAGMLDDHKPFFAPGCCWR